jgi:transcriptional regulator with XRE-family HTH domain
MPRPKKITTMKELRAAKGLSQAAFAKSIDVSTASVGAYEAGRINPSNKVLEKVNEVYGVQLPAPKKTSKKKKAAAKKTKPAAKKAPVKKEAAPAAKKAEVIIQSPSGGSITPDEILARVGEADCIYVRADENKAYWVRGEETGSIDLW